MIQTTLEEGKFYGFERGFAMYSHTGGNEHVFLTHYPIETEAGIPVVKHSVSGIDIKNGFVVSGEVRTEFLWPGDNGYRELNRRFNQLIRK